jgi:hypothetical protein
MGELLKSKRMDVVNLAYIIKLRPHPSKVAAAITLLAHELGQPETVQNAMRYGPKVHGGSKYLEEQQYDSMTMALFYGVVGLLGVGGLTLALIWSGVSRALQGYPWVLQVIAVLFWMLVLVLPIALYVRRRWNQELGKFRSYRDGREGEEWATNMVRAALDSRWTVFRSVKLPKRKEDIDLVLVGPAGVWALEVKAYSAPVRVQNKVWEYLSGKKWRTLDDPVGQVRKNAQLLRYYLDQYGLARHIEAAVVLAKPQQASNFGPTDEPVWFQFEVEGKLTGLNSMPATITEADRERILSTLTALVAIN